jgi:hypothetical protein
MELTERYLEAVRFWLPQEQSRDIIAELAEDLRSQVEERQAELGRNLEEQELVELLRRRGDPMHVAQQYLPKRCLIGPALFPLYWFTLKATLYFWAVPWLLVWIGFLIFSPGYRAANPGLSQVHNLATLWISLVYLSVMLTVGFAILERRGGLARIGWIWDPRRLPEPAAPKRISRTESVAGLAWNGILALWWAGLLKLPALPDVQIHPAPVVLRFFYWPILTLLCAAIVVEAINLVRPVYTRCRAAIRLVLAVCGLAVICSLLAVALVSGVITIAGLNLTTRAVLQGAKWTNLTCSLTLAAVAVATIGRIIREARMVRSR